VSDERTQYPGADASFGLMLDGEHDQASRDRIGQEVTFNYDDGVQITGELIARTVEGDTAFYHVKVSDDARRQVTGAALFAQFQRENPQYIFAADDPGPNERIRGSVLTPSVLERWMKSRGFDCSVRRDGSFMRITPIGVAGPAYVREEPP
jgi:hypothetical protein